MTFNEQQRLLKILLKNFSNEEKRTAKPRTEQGDEAHIYIHSSSQRTASQSVYDERYYKCKYQQANSEDPRLFSTQNDTNDEILCMKTCFTFTNICPCQANRESRNVNSPARGNFTRLLQKTAGLDEDALAASPAEAESHVNHVIKLTLRLL